MVNKNQKISAKSIKEAQDKIKKIKEDVQKEITNQLHRLISTEIVPSLIANVDFIDSIVNAVISIFIKWQSEYFDPSPAVKETDHTGFDFHKSSIREEVKNNLLISAQTYKSGSNKLNISSNINSMLIQLVFTLLSDDFIGTNKRGDKKGNSPIQWATYFIDGMEPHKKEYLVWLPIDLQIKLRKTRKKLSGTAKYSSGRFGTGVLIHLDSEGLNALQRRFEYKGITGNVKDYIHPQSNIKAPMGYQIIDAVEPIIYEYLSIKLPLEIEKTFSKYLNSK